MCSSLRWDLLGGCTCVFSLPQVPEFSRAPPPATSGENLSSCLGQTPDSSLFLPVWSRVDGDCSCLLFKWVYFLIWLPQLFVAVLFLAVACSGKPGPRHREHGALAPEPPGKSYCCLLLIFSYFSWCLEEEKLFSSSVSGIKSIGLSHPMDAPDFWSFSFLLVFSFCWGEDVKTFLLWEPARQRSLPTLVCASSESLSQRSIGRRNGGICSLFVNTILMWLKMPVFF